MIVVHIPKYERHPYCLRAYAATEELERKRFGGDRPADAKCGLIIPIIFHSGEDLPPNITGAVAITTTFPALRS
jgi:hypothetical protein